jgi:methylglutaconyl-CoA hydratase
MPSLCVIDSGDPMVTVMTLNRPQKRNALSIELMEQLTAAVRAASADLSRRVLILRASGSAFCAGLDLQEASDPALADRSAHALAELYTAICDSPLVTIVGAHGAAFGGGVGLIAACDLVLAGDDLRIGFPEVHRGLVAALVTCMVRRQVNERSLRELILLGQTISAERALSLGLINRIVTPDALPAESMNLAKEACKGAPGAIARTKRLLDDLSPRPIAEDLLRARAFHLHARESDEATEGIAAFLERRQPHWEPRKTS